jgi:hypothetical protein
MKTVFAAIFMLFTLAGSADPEAAIPYFKQARDVSISAPDHQNYLVVDAAIWGHARPDLGDLRLYDGAKQVPYLLTSRKATTTAQEDEAKILNLVQRGDHTEFDLDVGAATEYNRVRLVLNKKDFLITASVSGGNELASATATAWPTPSTLFDFSREKLGSNLTISLPEWSFRFLHVRLARGIAPKEVQSAIIGYVQERKAFWTDAGSCGAANQEKRQTVIACEVPPSVPVDRILFVVPEGRVNFRRLVSVANEKGAQVGASLISRVRMNRAGTSVVTDDLAVTVFGDFSGRLTVAVENGDDPPLTFDRVQPQSLERRVYFEPQGKTKLKLYYSDEKLTSPVYDYAKFFREDPNAALSQLSPETANPEYAGRPDDRPWSERHKSLLWVAMLAAVVVLAWLAVRGLKTGQPNS